MDPVLLILAAISGFILFRLISVMGTRTGHEPSQDVDPLESLRSDEPARTRDEFADAPAPVPTPVSTNARVLRDADPEFDEIEFLKGARGAYEMIIEAYTAGDLKSIRDFLADPVYDAFKQAVVAREGAGYTADIKFVGIEHAAIVDSRIEDDMLVATTEFSSNQVRVTHNSEGEVVDGDPNRIDLVKDRWIFKRPRDSRDPNWILSETGGG